MGNENATSEVCYECGFVFDDDHPSYGSLMPREPNFVTRKSSGEIIEASGFNWDYRVCLDDYKKQYVEVYPDQPVPLGVRKAEASMAAAGAYAASMGEGA